MENTGLDIEVGKGSMTLKDDGESIPVSYVIHLKNGAPERVDLTAYFRKKPTESVAEMRKRIHSFGWPMPVSAGAPSKDGRNIAAYLTAYMYHTEARNYYARLGQSPTKKKIDAYRNQRAYEFWESKHWAGGAAPEQFNKIKRAGEKKLKDGGLHMIFIRGEEAEQIDCVLLFKEAHIMQGRWTIYPVWAWSCWTQEALPIRAGSEYVALWSGGETNGFVDQQVLALADSKRPSLTTSMLIAQGQK